MDDQLARDRYRYLQLKAKMGGGGQAPPQQKGMMGNAWDALAVPEQMSRQGLKQLTNMIPEFQPKNKWGYVAANTPKLAAETLGEAAPGFVSRGAILTAGAMPALKGLGAVAETVGPGVAGQLESLSGMKPGLLGKAFKDPSLIFSSIPKGARQAYQESADIARRTSSEVSGIPRPLALAQKLLTKLKSGMISPDEALSGRKAVDQLWESKAITEDWKNMARRAFDSVAKMQPEIKEADIAFSRGKQAAGLRNLMPQNKYGGTSAFKTAIMAGLHGMGPAGKLGMAAMSPLAMGTGATALGAGAKALSPLVNNPRLAVALQQLIGSLIRKNQSPPQGQGQ